MIFLKHVPEYINVSHLNFLMGLTITSHIKSTDIGISKNYSSNRLFIDTARNVSLKLLNGLQRIHMFIPFLTSYIHVKSNIFEKFVSLWEENEWEFRMMFSQANELVH